MRLLDLPFPTLLDGVPWKGLPVAALLALLAVGGCPGGGAHDDDAGDDDAGDDDTADDDTADDDTSECEDVVPQEGDPLADWAGEGPPAW